MLVKPPAVRGSGVPKPNKPKLVAARHELQAPLDAFGTVGEVMSSSTPCLRVDVSIESARLVLVERGYSALPVVDARGMPVGSISTTDLLRVLPEYEFQELDARAAQHAASDPFEQPAEEQDAEVLEAGEGFFVVCIPERAVGSIMTPLIFTVSEHAPIGEAAALMAGHDLHHLAVVDLVGGVVGTISALDIVRLVTGQFMIPGSGRRPELQRCRPG
jgi:CBS domain-containing protein